MIQFSMHNRGNDWRLFGNYYRLKKIARIKRKAGNKTGFIQKKVDIKTISWTNSQGIQ